MGKRKLKKNHFLQLLLLEVSWLTESFWLMNKGLSCSHQFEKSCDFWRFKTHLSKNLKSQQNKERTGGERGKKTFHLCFWKFQRQHPNPKPYIFFSKLFWSISIPKNTLLPAYFSSQLLQKNFSKKNFFHPLQRYFF